MFPCSLNGPVVFSLPNTGLRRPSFSTPEPPANREEFGQVGSLEVPPAPAGQILKSPRCPRTGEAAPFMTLQLPRELVREESISPFHQGLSFACGFCLMLRPCVNALRFPIRLASNVIPRCPNSSRILQDLCAWFSSNYCFQSLLVLAQEPVFRRACLKPASLPPVLFFPLVDLPDWYVLSCHLPSRYSQSG